MLAPARRKFGTVSCAVVDLLHPPVERDPYQWADDCLILPKWAEEPGPFRSSRTPYFKPLAAAIADNAYKGAVGVCATQQGKTILAAAIFGQRLTDAPVPMMYVGPTRDFGEQIWEPRFMQMVDSAPGLAATMSTGRDRKSQKVFSGCNVTFAWSGSKSGIAGETACVVVVDERDLMDTSAGDPIAKANARHSTYEDGKTVVFSTPKVGNVESQSHPDTGLIHWKIGDPRQVQSPVWQQWQRGTRHEWMWPCPDCGTPFSPRRELVVWPDDKPIDEIRDEDVAVACPHCGGIVREHQREELNQSGVAIAPGQRLVDGEVVGKPPRSDWFSIWVSGMCSPWRHWGFAVREYLHAVESGESATIQECQNLYFGELHSVSGEAHKWEEVAALRLDYVSQDLPAEVSVLLMSVDVQKDRLYFVVRGWTEHRRMESYLVDYGTIEGDTSETAVWDALAEYTIRAYGARELQISRCFIDQKYRTQHVFAFCRDHKNWAFPTVGILPRSETNQAPPLSTSSVEVSAEGKILKGGETGLQRWRINTDFFKRWVHDRVALGPKGRFFIPADADDDYCKQLVAEARVVHSGGQVEWLVTAPDNHYLDCESMNVACAYSVRLQHYAQPTGQEDQGEDESKDDDEPAPRPRPRPPPPRRNWTTQW